MPIKKTFSATGAAAAVLALGLAAGSGQALAAAAAATPAYIELPSAHAFAPTVQRIRAGLEGAGMTIFASIDHQAAARQVGLDMLPATVLVYGNPKGGTPLMQATPALALDLPLRVLVREDANSKTFVLFHPATTLTRPLGVPDEQATPLMRSEALIRQAVAP